MADLIEQLRSRLPAMRVLTDAVDTESYRFDETAFLRAGTPLAVAFPTSTADVVEIVRLASAAGVPIVARGAGTGLSGGAVAIDGALTVAFTKMNAILEIDTANLTATVQPGVIN
ncbi:MAG: FAD-binding oxidoreductase, partial [Chloroflexota bacterium]